jgi:hypothetical protein
MADPELDSAAEGAAAKTSWAKATQLSKRSAGFLANPLRMASDVRRGIPGRSSAKAGGTTIVWFTTVADGVGPSMQLVPESTSCTVIASEYWSTRPSNARPITISGAT